MLVINKVYLLLRDAKLILRDSIFKLIINKVYLLLRDAKLLLRNFFFFSSYRVCIGRRKPGKSWNRRISFSTPGKSENLTGGPCKLIRGKLKFSMLV